MCLDNDAKVIATKILSVWLETLNLYVALPFSVSFVFLWLPVVYLGGLGPKFILSRVWVHILPVRVC